MSLSLFYFLVRYLMGLRSAVSVGSEVSRAAYCDLGPDNSLSLGVVLCILGCLAAPLASTPRWWYLPPPSPHL